MSFNLRPVSDSSESPSPTSPTSPTGHSPTSKGHPANPPSALMASNGRPRRPLSPTSLRDVDLNHAPDMPHRKYAAPLTGHDLMAMFPPAPPVITEMRGGPTSGYFQRQERAFFAKAGREIVRVRMEVDIQNGADADGSKTRGRDASRLWPNSTHPHQSPIQTPSAYPHPSGSRAPPRGTAPVTSMPLYPIPSPSSQHPPNHHTPALRTPPHESPQSGPKSEFSQDDYPDDDAWRRPMPYAERRRAGKHTRRVIVRT
ncbi:hypothetical protein H0H87_007397 [Tephrocybe sp. NHM501043]|nr:hypothetical protein H0H87_007397 [Tephrocybe sp. NHM501043]